MKRYYKFVLLICLLPFLYKFCERQTDGFRVARILTSSSGTQIGVTPQELPTLLGQKFYYLASGGQAWVFVSEDQQYVLKFFKTYKRKAKSSRDFASCQLAYDKLKEECGLLYLHLHATSHLNLSVTLVDKLHIEHPIALDQTAFLVQKKAVLLYDHIEQTMRAGNLEGAKQALSAACQLIRTRSEKGIFDEDARIHCNLGFIGAKAILIDTGRLKEDARRKEPAVMQKDLKKITHKLKLWLELHYPELVPHLEQETLL
ncbi:MAG TPA: hypothetical protein VLF61_00585 [Rhabdochlamydiaceae bacterium]|nr:hypothetical protein [Rhabdochlamydiaceae bacterium]